jgi:protein gp37
MFLSVEPQLGPVNINRWSDRIDWVIVGGESGPGHRPFDVEWARTLMLECRLYGVAFHYKQFGGLHHADGGCLLDGVEVKEFPKPRELVA